MILLSKIKLGSANTAARFSHSKLKDSLCGKSSPRLFGSCQVVGCLIGAFRSWHPTASHPRPNKHKAGCAASLWRLAFCCMPSKTRRHLRFYMYTLNACKSPKSKVRNALSMKTKSKLQNFGQLSLACPRRKDLLENRSSGKQAMNYYFSRYCEPESSPIPQYDRLLTSASTPNEKPSSLKIIVHANVSPSSERITMNYVPASQLLVSESIRIPP